MTTKKWKQNVRLPIGLACAFFGFSLAVGQTPSVQEGPFSSNSSLLGNQTGSQQTFPNPQSSLPDIGQRNLNLQDPAVDNRDQLNLSGPERNGRLAIQNALEPVELTPFQRLVAASVGRVLPIYGARLFNNVPSTFAPVDRIPVTPNYVVGPGDELLIRAWGQVSLDGHFTVDRSGEIYIPQVGAIRVAGTPFSQLTQRIRSQMSRTLRNFDLNVNLGQLRSIQVFVVGEAKRPGSYTVSSLSTLVNTLFAAGGPSPTGSMRNIEVKRGDKTVAKFDFYDLLLRGDKSQDIQLLSGDVVFIPPAQSMVAVAGSVNTPALYEIKAGSNLHELLTLCGGLSTVANSGRVRIERITQEDTRSILDIQLNTQGFATDVQDGDIVEVSPVIDRFKNSITLRGNVADPRRFAWFPGMRISDVIPDKEALLTRDFWQQRNRLGQPVLDSTPDVRRYAPDAPVAQVNGQGLAPAKPTQLLTAQGALDSDTNVAGRNIPNPDAGTSTGLQRDSLLAPSSGVVVSRRSNNSVASPEDALLDQAASPGSTDIEDLGHQSSARTVSASVTGVAQRFPAKNAVILTAPEIDWAYAVIERLNAKDLTTQLVPFNLGRVLLDKDTSQNVELQPGDVITIFSKADVRVPQSQQTKYIRLEGEFVSAGTYSVQPGETLRQLVARTGGLTPNAYLYGSEFNRESTRVLQQQRLNDYAADLDRRIKLAEANAANNTLNPQDQITDIAALQQARAVAIRLQLLRATGRIVFNLLPNSKTVADIPDLPLEDGDTFIVPQVPLSVDVFGSVYTQGSFLYDPRKRAEDYIRKAGGGTRTADTHRSFIVRADGSVVSRQFATSLFTGNFGATHLYPGDAIVVPESVDRRPLLRNLVDVATIVGQFGLGVAAINVLK